MNYNYLRYFSVLAQLEHYTLAAARLGISQPSLSSAIHHLEEELGDVRLFEKVGRNIRLTEEGRYFQERVDAALKELNEASNTLRDSRTSAPVIIRLGVVSGTLDSTVAKEILSHIRQNDRIRFRLTESSAEELMDLVREKSWIWPLWIPPTVTAVSISAVWDRRIFVSLCRKAILLPRKPSSLPSRWHGNLRSSLITMWKTASDNGPAALPWRNRSSAPSILPALPVPLWQRA